MSGVALASDARLLEAVRSIGTRYGVDYTDDATVSALLAEWRRAVEGVQHGPWAWLGGLALAVGVVWPFLGPEVPSFAGKPLLAYGPAGPLLLIAVAALVLVRVRWKRELLHEALAGYRQVLGLAQAHGIALTHVPAWLEGRSSTGGGKGAAPIPSYAPVEPLPTRSPQAMQPPHPSPPSQGTPTATVPPKPRAVALYEEIADAGGWHDEAGCLLLFAGAGGAMWAATSDNPVGYGALLLVPVAIAVWLAGSRQGREKQRLRAEAVAYVRAVAAAQAAGAQVPELPPVLRKLLDE